MFKIQFFFLLVAMALIGCNASTPPKPNTTGPIHTLGGGFLVQDGQLKYGMTYVSKSLPEPAYARAEFQNPSSDEAPLKTDLGKLNLESEIVVQSPAFPAIKNNTTYWVTLYIYSDAAQSQLLHTHHDKVQFAMPSSYMRSIGIQEL